MAKRQPPRTRSAAGEETDARAHIDATSVENLGNKETRQQGRAFLFGG
jgi:hypothetical protein